ncbi:MFS transporter [Ligilactobacillus saerimneri]|uniref:MFS transporter n=1 Tax=Ligilactobacillus saerimneri TaxID=228229 RepID=UPI0024B044A7|nr:MFS transporter [Ligilactobacillus saerimneri]MDI9206569.1 MFS transporter [Ligilactobacillus saerimneri]
MLGTHLRRRTNPFIDIALLADQSFVRVIANDLIINIILLGVLLLLPLLLADIYQLSSVTTGAIFFLAALFSSTASMLSGRLLVHYNQVALIYGGTGLMIIGLIILSIFASHSLLLTILGTILIFISYSTIQVALNSFVPLALNDDCIGVGLGLYNLTNFIGMALGPALASKLLELGANYSFLFLGVVLVVLPLFPLLYKLVLPTQNSLLQD